MLPKSLREISRTWFTLKWPKKTTNIENRLVHRPNGSTCHLAGRKKILQDSSHNLSQYFLELTCGFFLSARGLEVRPRPRRITAKTATARRGRCPCILCFCQSFWSFDSTHNCYVVKKWINAHYLGSHGIWRISTTCASCCSVKVFFWIFFFFFWNLEFWKF